MYETKLREHGLGSAQILLTHADLADRERYLNARSTLLTLLQHRVLPVINENDTVVNDEIKFGDNDTLGALVANLIEADLLIILTDQKGLYTADPRKDPAATFVHEARAGDITLETMAGGAGSSLGKGGMITKILAAKRAAGSGASTVIAWGREPDALLRQATSPQTVDGRPFAVAWFCDRRCGRRPQSLDRRQESLAHWHERRDRRLLSRRCHCHTRRARGGNRPRFGQLRQRRSPLDLPQGLKRL
jgi:glutamate 5-kinase